MKEWKKPELWDLSIEKTEAQLGGGGNDQRLPDCIENPIEHFFGDIFGRKS